MNDKDRMYKRKTSKSIYGSDLGYATKKIWTDFSF